MRIWEERNRIAGQRIYLAARRLLPRLARPWHLAIATTSRSITA